MAKITIDNITNILSRYDFEELEVKQRGNHYWLYIFTRYHEENCEQDFSLHVRFTTPQELVEKIIETDVEKIVTSEYKERADCFFGLESHCHKIKSLCEEWGETLKDIISKMKFLLQAVEYQELQDSYDFLKENGTLLAKYCIYYTGTDMVDTSIEWYLICGCTYMYVSDENTAYPDACLDAWQAGYDVHEDELPLVDGDYGYWDKTYDFDKDELNIKGV